VNDSRAARTQAALHLEEDVYAYGLGMCWTAATE
jgi:hypothetical protein